MNCFGTQCAFHATFHKPRTPKCASAKAKSSELWPQSHFAHQKMTQYPYKLKGKMQLNNYFRNTTKVVKFMWYMGDVGQKKTTFSLFSANQKNCFPDLFLKTLHSLNIIRFSEWETVRKSIKRCKWIHNPLLPEILKRTDDRYRPQRSLPSSSNLEPFYLGKLGKSI